MARGLTRKHQRNLAAVMAVSRNLRWRSVTAMLEALGGAVDENRAGSRFALVLDGHVFVDHTPHGSDTMSYRAVRNLKEFLKERGY